MTSNTFHIEKLARDAVHVSNVSSLDTSLLLEELKREFERSRKPLVVDFRELVHWVKLGNQVTHQIHPYPAKLLPHIANFFVNASSLSTAEDVVVDPFCGSGTVALEASLAARQAFVADANPFALLLTKVKTTPYDPASLVHFAAEIHGHARRYKKAAHIPVVNEGLWYSRNRKLELERLLRAINDVDESVRDFFRICFSVVAKRISNADPAISVPVRIREKPNLTRQGASAVKAHLDWLRHVNVLEEFERVCVANIDRVYRANAANPDRQAARAVATDARDITSVERGGAALVLTSPPYGSAQKYVRASSLSLNWLELASPDQLKQIEERTIGREHITLRERCEDVSFGRFDKFLARVRKLNPKRELITRFFLSELQQALREAVRIARPGGHLVFVVGNNSVCGEDLATDAYVKQVMEEAGAELRLQLIDHIKSRGLITRRNSTASVIARESVLLFKKH